MRKRLPARFSKLVEEAVGRCDGDLKGLDRDSFIDELSPDQRKAIRLFDLFSVVGNGGFLKWLGDGCNKDGDDIVRYFEDMGGASALQGREIITKIVNLIRVKYPGGLEELRSDFIILDAQFCNLLPGLLIEVEEWFNRLCTDRFIRK
jgi:hypothetical protein